MTRYVEGFLFVDERVLLIEKQRPSWMKNLWNGVGGHIEEGETDLEAMRREFREETGTVIDNWEHFATLRSSDFEVVFYRVFLPECPPVQQTTDEAIYWWNTNDLPNTIPNLKWLVPMASDKADTKLPYHITENA
jgi:8-oxo-dGTP pyrophosphatase MutT (NUDIX family)